MNWFGSGSYGQTVTVESTVVPSRRLFPTKIRRDVTIYAAFGLE